MKSEVKFKFTGEDIIEILKSTYDVDPSKNKLVDTHIQIKDNRENEWENNYGIDYIEFTYETK